MLHPMPSAQAPLEVLRPVDLLAAESTALALLNAVSRQQLDSSALNSVTLMAATEILASEASTPGELAVSSNSRPLEIHDPASPEPAQLSISSTKPAPEHLPSTEPHAQLTHSHPAQLDARIIAQAVALSVQDSVNFLRNLEILVTASIGSSLANLDTTRNAGNDLPQFAVARDLLQTGRQQLYETASLASSVLQNLSQLPAASPANPDSDGHGFDQLGDLWQSISQSLAQASANAVQSQQQVNITSQAALVQGIATLYSLDTAATGETVQRILGQQPQSPTESTPAVPITA